MSEPQFPSWEKYVVGAISVMEAKHDREDTLTVAITHRELALVVAALISHNRLFPEFGGVGMELVMKLQELTQAQEFLGRDDGSEVVDIKEWREEQE